MANVFDPVAVVGLAGKTGRVVDYCARFYQFFRMAGDAFAGIESTTVDNHHSPHVSVCTVSLSALSHTGC